MRQTKTIFAFALLAIWGIPGLVSAQVEDTIIGPSGTPTRGTITGVTRQSVKMNDSGSEKVFSVPEIRMLRFAGEPTELENAKKFLIQDRVNDAQAELQKIALGDVKQDLIKMEIEYYLAYCGATLALQGTNPDKKGAGAALKIFVDNPAAPKYTQTHHFYEAAELLGDLYMSVGLYGFAENAYAMLSGAPGEWTEHHYRAKVLTADSQLANAQAGKGDYQKALANYSTVANAQGTKETARYKQLASVGQAICYAGVNQADKGVALLEDIIEKEDPKDMELFGKAYNALGACYLKMHEQEKDAKKKASLEKKALMAFLRTDVLFWKDPKAHAEALYHLSELWQKVNKPDRATKARATLKDRYAGSRWSQNL